MIEIPCFSCSGTSAHIFKAGMNTSSLCTIVEVSLLPEDEKHVTLPDLFLVKSKLGLLTMTVFILYFAV